MRPCVHVETNVHGNLLAVEELERQTEEKCAHEHEHSRGAVGSLQEREDGTSDASDEHFRFCRLTFYSACGKILDPTGEPFGSLTFYRLTLISWDCSSSHSVIRLTPQASKPTTTRMNNSTGTSVQPLARTIKPRIAAMHTF